MQSNEVNALLLAMLSSQPEVSDLNFTVGKPPQVETTGQLVPVTLDPPITRLTPFQTEQVAFNLVGGSRRFMEELLQSGSCDLSHTPDQRARFRVNIFSQRGHLSIVLRTLNPEVPTLEQLGLPPVFTDISREMTGLVLVTGATGSGKSTTMAAILNAINEQKAIHVVTLEDPIEFIHAQRKATFNQRELSTDFDTFANGLRAALRQAPKIILVGEMRDRETAELAITAAETGHLVLSTLHTIDCGQTINRIVGMFDREEERQLRQRLAGTLRWVVSQRLAPKFSGGRHALLEIMGTNLRVKESIVQGESEGKTFYEIIEASGPFGWRTFDQSCVEAFEQKIITEESALLHSNKRSICARGIDNIKKRRGEKTSDVSGLSMKSGDGPDGKSNKPTPLTLRLK